MNELDRYLDDNGFQLAYGLLGGILLVLFLIIVIAFSNRRPPDK